MPDRDWQTPGSSSGKRSLSATQIPEHTAPKFRQDKPQKAGCCRTHHNLWRLAEIDLGKRTVRLTLAFALCDFHEQQAFIREIGIKRRLRHPRNPRNHIYGSAFKPVLKKDAARPF